MCLFCFFESIPEPECGPFNFLFVGCLSCSDYRSVNASADQEMWTNQRSVLFFLIAFTLYLLGETDGGQIRGATNRTGRENAARFYCFDYEHLCQNDKKQLTGHVCVAYHYKFPFGCALDEVPKSPLAKCLEIDKRTVNTTKSKYRCGALNPQPLGENG